MAAEALSYAQSLRVIGQDLHGLGIDSFELDKTGDQYTVRMNTDEPAPRSRKSTFLDRVVARTRGSETSARQIPNPRQFTRSKILWLDVEKRLRRSESNAMPDARNLSLVLRVLGDYLDRKAVGDFAISWSTDSVKVSYGKKVESFTVEDLYDLGVRMYLRRSSRLRGK
ncbi:MAG: hypothetical protein ACREQ2_18365 [Candidatus Binatia bacterium]